MMSLAGTILGICAVLQFGWLLFTGRRNVHIAGFGADLGDWLGRSAACARPAGCPAGEALYSPGPDDETWHYSLGHWVENDPERGDGSFSSPGAFGFYPWINADRSLYGVVARAAGAGSGLASARCGRLIRQAWRTGVAV